MRFWNRDRAGRRLAPRARLTVVAAGIAVAACAGAAFSAEAVEVIPLSQGFETGRGTFTAVCNGGCTAWERTTNLAYSGSYSMFADDVPTATENELDLYTPIAIPVNATEATLTFRQVFDFERNESFFYDGGVLEIWSDNSQGWIDGASYIVAGGYSGSLASGSAANVLRGRSAWVGNSDGWQLVVVDLKSFRGQGVRFRLRLGTDGSNISEFAGWWVDDFEVTYRAPLEACDRHWDEASPYPSSVFRAGLVGMGDALFAFGGLVRGEATVQAFRYSVEDDVWSPIASLPSPRDGATAVTDGTYIYILGGWEGGMDMPRSNLWRYDPGSNNYSTLESFSVAAAESGAAYVDGFIYRVAGDGADQLGTVAVERYSIQDGTWQSAAAYPGTLRGVVATAIGGQLYTAGGLGYQLPSEKAYRYDAARDFWDDGPVADLPMPGGKASGATYRGNWIVGATSGLYSWNPSNNNWRSLDQPPVVIPISLVASAGSSAFVLGAAESAFSDQARLLRYTESSCSTCVGDCGDDRVVSVADLVRGVRILNHLDRLGTCSAFDADDDGEVDVTEVRQAVVNDLAGCAAGG